MNKDEWDERYRGGDAPWDRPTPTEHLPWAIETFGIAPCKVIDIGCGTGTNVIWLAQQGFDAVGVDFSPLAVAQARAKAADAGVDCSFEAVDFLDDPVGGGPFGWAFDRGCFHSVEAGAERDAFARKVADLLTPGGLWLSLIGSTDTPPREMGPPQVSARQITAAVEDRFEVLLLEANSFRNGTDETYAAWRCFMRKREAE